MRKRERGREIKGKKTKEKLSKNNPVTIEYGSLKVKASTASAKSIINAPFFKALFMFFLTLNVFSFFFFSSILFIILL